MTWQDATESGIRTSPNNNHRNQRSESQSIYNEAGKRCLVRSLVQNQYRLCVVLKPNLTNSFETWAFSYPQHVTEGLLWHSNLRRSPLQEPMDFRVLELFPGEQDETLNCSLTHCSLILHPYYHAVPYTWRTPGLFQEIELCGAAHSIHANLFDFLQQLRLNCAAVTL